MHRAIACVLLACLAVTPATAQNRSFSAVDSLDIAQDERADTQSALDGLAWEPSRFDVVVAPARSGARDAVVWFPSPRPGADARQARVPMEWFVARDSAGEPLDLAPAIIMLHSLHPRMPVARLVGGSLSRRGVHVFVVHLPGYGLRASVAPRAVGVTAVRNVEQAVADIRRARDAVAALPRVAPGPIAIAGVSLGGFAASVAASLDGAFDPVVLVLSGADVFRVLDEGKHDAAHLRAALERDGLAGDTLREVLRRVEPSLVVHRLIPDRTWLFSARDDEVVPAASSELLSRAIGLDAAHHVVVAGNHYTAALALPAIINQIEAILKPTPVRVEAPADPEPAG